jgi:hypothetical protein
MIEPPGMAVTLWNHIQVVLNSSLGQDTYRD